MLAVVGGGPAGLAAAFRTAHAELYREGHLLTQAALAAFIEEGHYAAHIRRMRNNAGWIVGDGANSNVPAGAQPDIDVYDSAAWCAPARPSLPASS